MGFLDTLIRGAEEGGGIFDKLAPKGGRTTPAKPPNRGTPQTTQQRGGMSSAEIQAHNGMSAMMQAGALKAIDEQMRPNRVYSLIGSDPTAFVDFNTTIDCELTLNQQKTQLCYVFGRAFDEDNFLCSLLEFDGFNIIGGSPVNLGMVVRILNRIDRVLALTGRELPKGTKIKGKFLNAADDGNKHRFGGLGLAVLEPTCQQDLGSTKPAVGSYGFGAFKQVWTGWFGKNVPR